MTEVFLTVMVIDVELQVRQHLPRDAQSTVTVIDEYCADYQELFPEGAEVVGRNNISVVSLQWSADDTHKVAIQQTYWHPPWKPTRTVQSRYCVLLEGDRVP
jgi:hypothetical protein